MAPAMALLLWACTYNGRGLGVVPVVETDGASADDGPEPTTDARGDGATDRQSPDAAPDVRSDGPPKPADAAVDAPLAPDAPQPDAPVDAPAQEVALDAPLPDVAPPLPDVGPDGLPNGQSCSTNSGCQSGFCVAGLCCDSACAGTCRSCVGERTGQPSGTCAPVTAGKTDPGCPREEPATCGRDGTCDGNGACRRYPDGTTCGGVCCNSGPGGRKPCTFACRAGTCDVNTPIPGERCQIGNCCCPTGGPAGGPSCTLPLICPNAMCF
jgi:hypothetical protein